MNDTNETNAGPTLYPEVNTVLQALQSGVQRVLGDQLVGIYIHGSLATDEFKPQRSDIDFLVVTADELSGGTLLALAAMHTNLTDSGMKWANRLEGSYIPQAALRRYDPEHAEYPALRADGSFDVDHHSSDWVIQRHLLHEHGISLAGPDLSTLIDPVEPEDLQRAALGILQEWWEPQVRNHTRLRSNEYQAYAILTMCRALYTLRTGEVTSKSTAADWACSELGEPWAELIQWAEDWQPGDPADKRPETVDFIRFTLERARDWQAAGGEG